MRLALLLLLASCGASPDYLEVTPSYGEGGLQRVGSLNRADSQTYAIGVTFGWNLNADRREAYRNLAGLDIDRAGRLTMRPDHSDESTVVVVPQGSGEGEGSNPTGIVGGMLAIAAAIAAIIKVCYPKADLPDT